MAGRRPMRCVGISRVDDSSPCPDVLTDLDTTGVALGLVSRVNTRTMSPKDGKGAGYH